MKKNLTALVLIFSALIGSAQVNLSSSLTACYGLNGNGSEPVNGLTATLSAVTSTVDRFNNTGNALYFSGATSSYVQLPDDPLIKPSNALSFSMWVKPNSNTVAHILFTKNSMSSNFEAYQLAIYSGGPIFILNKSSSTGGDAAFSTTTITPGTWYHVVGTLDNSYLKLYINGTLEGSTASTFNGFDFVSGKSVFLGNSNESSFNYPLNGTIDNVKFYNRTLSASEVSSLYSLDPSCNAPISSFSVTPAIACVGNTLSLADLSSASPISWNWQTPGALTSSTTIHNPVVTYSSPGIYTITLVATNTVGAGFITSQTLSVLPNPTITIAAPSLFCAGQTTTLTASGGTAYVWNTSQTGTQIAISPLQNTTYSVTAPGINGCFNSAQYSATVFPTPALVVNASTTLCAGATVSAMVSSGTAISYTWSNGVVTNSILTIPLSTTIYTVTGADLQGCTNTATFGVTVNSLPVLTVNGNSAVCLGLPTTFSVGGNALTYTWSTNATGNLITVTPNISTSYTVLGTDVNGCIGSATRTLAVLANPSVAITSSFPVFCAGKTVTLTASGASTYSWNTNLSNQQQIVITPLQNTNYTVVGVGANGCINVFTYSVLVTPVPTVIINGNSSMCAGITGFLLASSSGAANYLWSSGVTNSTMQIQPLGSTDYSVTVTDLQGCTNTATFGVIVNPLPVITVSGNSTVCQGLPTTLLASGSAFTYTWSTNVTGNLTTVTPNISTSYTVLGTDINGCVGSTTQFVFVNSLPSVMVNANVTTACAGDAVILGGVGAATYTWSGGIINNAAFYPNSTAVYTVTGTSTNGCKNSTTIVIMVNSLPVLSHSINPVSSVCAGEPVTLSVGGANIYNWNTGDVMPTIVVTPTANTNYSVMGTDANGCKATYVFAQIVNACLGLREQEIKNNITIYPNPTNGKITIEASAEVVAEYAMFNLLGTQLFKGKISEKENSISIENYPKGIYFLKIKNERLEKTVRIVKE